MSMTDIQIKRTEVLIEELIKLRATTEKPQFNMKQWMSNFLTRMPGAKALLHREIMEATKNPCGTSACLAGKAGLIPRIRRMGFKWDVVPEPKSSRYYDTRACFQYDGLTGDNAAVAFFGNAVYHGVFMNYGEIRTLLQGINALKEVVAKAKSYNESYYV